MSIYCSVCPSFKEYEFGQNYPWRDFTYNHTPSFMCLVFDPVNFKDTFSLYVVIDGFYQIKLSDEDSDEVINKWISEVNVVVEKEKGQHLVATSASDIRRYVKEYYDYLKYYKELRKPDQELEEKGYELSRLAKTYPVGSFERVMYEKQSKELLEQRDQKENEILPLIDELEEVFSKRWYKDIPSDEVFHFGWLIENYHAVVYGKLKDLVSDRTSMILYYLQLFNDHISSYDEKLFEQYYEWNQPDQLTLNTIIEMIAMLVQLNTKE